MEDSKPKTCGQLQLKEDFSFRLYTHNIRYDNKNLWKGEYDWKTVRKYLVSQSIKFNAQYSTIVCLQEVLNNQLNDILHLLNKDNNDEWISFGVGRDDGTTKGEYSPILFKKSEWELINGKTFWLSETPDKPSKSWDAALERIVTWCFLKNIKTGVKINIFNTHFDHKGIIARRESAKLILKKAKEINEFPSFITGDLNTKPVDEPYSIISNDSFNDAREMITNEHDKYGYLDTCTGFDGNGDSEHETKIIDYIFVPDIQYIQVKTFAVLNSRFNGVYISDHRPVSADISIIMK